MGILTVRAVQAAKPEHTRREIPDGTGTGLYLAIEPTGTKSWVLRCRHEGTPKRITLGRAGEGGLSLVAARHAATAARHRIEQGIVSAPASHSETGDATVGDRIETAIAAFLELHAFKKNRISTAQASERIFNRLVLPVWRGRPIDGIRKRDVIDLIESIATDRPYLANRTAKSLPRSQPSR